MEILFHDDDIIAINKPNGLFVHRTSLDPDADTFVVQEVRDMIGQYVYPVHRLDRKTSGVLVLAKSKEIQSLLNAYFRDRVMDKKYLAIVRGYADDKGSIDYALMSENGKLQESKTNYQSLQEVEIAVSSGKFPTSRYSLVELSPETGRRHQLRRHMAHILHPIIGDRPHGCNKQNKFFLEHFEMNAMLLHARSIRFEHPINHEDLTIQAPIFGEFQRMYETLGFDIINRLDLVIS